MIVISRPDYIKCSFGSDCRVSTELYADKIEVFYSEAKDLNSFYPVFRNYISTDEQCRADKFFFDEERQTFITCHALLRLILAKKLSMIPLEVSFVKGKNNKPELPGSSFFFNIAHTRRAFTIAVSRDHQVGIDLEEIDQRIDIQDIIEAYFSIKEREYILESKTDAKGRFFLLWTRKEALLKAIGTGIITNLPQIEVSERENIIYKKSFDNLICDFVYNEHFIYSEKVLNYYLSIALPQKAVIVMNPINQENIGSYLN